MTAKPSPQDQEIIDILKRLETLKAEYPPELLAARRAAFIAQVEEHTEVGVKEELASEAQVVEVLAARRSAFLAQLKQQKEIEAKEGLASEAQVVEALGSIKNAEPEYPSEL